MFNDMFNSMDVIEATTIGQFSSRGRRRAAVSIPVDNYRQHTDKSIPSVFNYRIKLGEFFNIVFDTLIGNDSELILAKYPHRPTTLLVISHKNWRDLYDKEFPNDQYQNSKINKKLFKNLVFGLNEIIRLSMNPDDVANVRGIKPSLLKAVLNGEKYKICKTIEETFYNFRLNNCK